MNTEEAFVLASLKEFVKLWGSGTQASLNLECKNGQAWIHFGAMLGSPASSHFDPTTAPVRKKKSQARKEKDRVRAAEHRAKTTVPLVAPSEAASPTSPLPRPPADTAYSSAQSIMPASAPLANSSPPPPARSMCSSSAVILAENNPLIESVVATNPPVVNVSVAEEVQEPIKEAIEKVHATDVIENSPDEKCDWQEIYNLVVKEHHMRNNIVDIKMNHESSRKFRSNLFTHTVSMILTAKTVALWESPRQYVWKHLGQNEWKKKNGTAIKFVRIHLK